jgi:aminoglycoside 3-N-acetyltransferase
VSYDFQKQLHALGLNKGDVVFMHSSMKSLKTDKTPEEFIADVMSVIGSDGTLLVPAFTWANVNVEQPYFNAKETEPCDGLIPRRFMCMPGVIRSLNPTHSVSALGKYAVELTAKHIQDETAVGPNSPVMKILDYSGKILFIGDVLHACTFMHGVEGIVEPPYCRKKHIPATSLTMAAALSPIKT